MAKTIHDTIKDRRPQLLDTPNLSICIDWISSERRTELDRVVFPRELT